MERWLLALIRKDEKIRAVLEATQNDDSAVLLFCPKQRHLDRYVSLMPEKTFRGRANGMRADLGQAIADRSQIHAIPGGCLVHATIGEYVPLEEYHRPVEQRREQRNIWNYHQSVGLGYFESSSFARTLAQSHCRGAGGGELSEFRRHLEDRRTGRESAMDEMPGYIDEVLDLIEYANGPATSVWERKGRRQGIPRPFNLEYLAIGNEDKANSGFQGAVQSNL